MADCSNVEEGMEAAALGFDLIGTTMASYTPYTRGCPLPPFDMIEYLVKNCGKPVVAEGNIITPEHLRHAMDLGVLTAVSGRRYHAPSGDHRRFVAATEMSGRYRGAALDIGGAAEIKALPFCGRGPHSDGQKGMPLPPARAVPPRCPGNVLRALALRPFRCP
ncbi:MAG: hypothetical protein ACLSAF_23145 [Intestinimonas sp.]